MTKEGDNSTQGLSAEERLRQVSDIVRRWLEQSNADLATIATIVAEHPDQKQRSAVVFKGGQARGILESMSEVAVALELPGALSTDEPLHVEDILGIDDAEA